MRFLAILAFLLAASAQAQQNIKGSGTAGTADASPVTIQGIAGMTKVLVTPDSVALPANQSVNVAQVSGTTASVNNGAADAGTLRVSIANNSTGMVAPATSAIATGALTCYVTSAASTNSTNCKNAAGNVYGIYIVNTTTTNYFLRMYNSSSAPTCSSATGFVETIPALGAAANGGGISRMQWPQAYTTGISFCLTGGGSSTDNTNAATGIYVFIPYQ